MAGKRIGRVALLAVVLAGMVGAVALVAGRRGTSQTGSPVAQPHAPSATAAQYRGGPAHAGVMPGPGPRRGAGERWTWQPDDGGAIHADPVVADGALYLVSFATNGAKGHLYALDAATGQTRWSFPIGTTENTVPAAADGTVYVGSADYHVYAVTAADGQQRWAAIVDGWISGGGVAVADGVVYVGTGTGSVYALDAATGAQRWKASGLKTISDVPAVAGKVVYVVSWSGALVALDTASGKERWRFALGSTNDDASPVVVDGTVYIGTNTGTLFALDAASGQQRWQVSFGKTSILDPAVAGGVVYASVTGFPTTVNHVVALDAATGQERWRRDLGSVYAPLVAGDTLYLSGIFAPRLVALDLAGDVRWQIPFPGGTTNPVVAAGLLYVTGGGGLTIRTLHALGDGAPAIPATPYV